MKILILLLTLLITLPTKADNLAKFITVGEPQTWGVLYYNKQDNFVIEPYRGAFGLTMWGELDKRKTGVVLSGHSTTVIPDMTFRVYNFSPIDKYKYVAKTFCIDVLLAANPKSNIRNMQDVIAAEKAGKKIQLAAFQAALSKIIITAVNEKYKTNLEMVPYIDINRQKADVMGGHVDLLLADAGLFDAEFSTGHLRPILNLGKKNFSGVEKVDLIGTPIQFCWYAATVPTYDAKSEIEIFKRLKSSFEKGGLTGPLQYYDMPFILDQEEVKKDVIETRKKYQAAINRLKIEKQ